MGETPMMPTLYRYEFFIKAQGGINPQPMIVVIAAQPIESAEVRTMVEQVRGQLATQPGVGIVPRPSYYTAAELYPMPEASETEKRGVMLLLPQKNGEGA